MGVWFVCEDGICFLISEPNNVVMKKARVNDLFLTLWTFVYCFVILKKKIFKIVVYDKVNIALCQRKAWIKKNVGAEVPAWRADKPSTSLLLSFYTLLWYCLFAGFCHLLHKTIWFQIYICNRPSSSLKSWKVVFEATLVVYSRVISFPLFLFLFHFLSSRVQYFLHFLWSFEAVYFFLYIPGDENRGHGGIRENELVLTPMLC